MLYLSHNNHVLIVLGKNVTYKKKKKEEQNKVECESLELLAAACPWRQDSRGELSHFRLVMSRCSALSIYKGEAEKLTIY